MWYPRSGTATPTPREGIQGRTGCGRRIAQGIRNHRIRYSVGCWVSPAWSPQSRAQRSWTKPPIIPAANQPSARRGCVPRPAPEHRVAGSTPRRATGLGATARSSQTTYPKNQAGAEPRPRRRRSGRTGAPRSSARRSATRRCMPPRRSRTRAGRRRLAGRATPRRRGSSDARRARRRDGDGDGDAEATRDGRRARGCAPRRRPGPPEAAPDSRRGPRTRSPPTRRGRERRPTRLPRPPRGTAASAAARRRAARRTAWPPRPRRRRAPATRARSR